MQHLLSASTESLRQWLAERGHPPYRVAQIWQWVFDKRAGAFEEMTDLPKRLREELAKEWQIWTSQTVRHEQAPDGTEKLLLEFPGGGRIECVLLRDGDR